MHKLTCRAFKLSNTLSKNGVLACSQRFLRVEPEEELDRLFIKESFEDRMAKLPKSEPPKMIGRQYDPPRVHSHKSHDHGEGAADDSKDLQEEFSLESVYEEYMEESYAFHVVPILQHYEVYKHLFNQNVYFYPDPSLDFHVGFRTSSNDVIPVVNGNRIPPSDTASVPLIQFTGKPDHLYSILLINLDGHLQNPDGAYLHWYSGMIKGSIKQLVHVFLTVKVLIYDLWFEYAC